MTNRDAMAYCVFRTLGCSYLQAQATIVDMEKAVPRLARFLGKKWRGKPTPADALILELLRRERIEREAAEPKGTRT